ncbi:MAG TPA: DUF4129 domain-containing protein [Streptosporangiaceae bacterium]|nr:DUF4129 domain-containing protein [Streptosporangiaceae bacterium]
MPDRIRARALVIALLLVLTVAAIGSLGPRGDALKDANAVLAVSVALELTMAGLLIALYRQTPALLHVPATPVAFRLNHILRAVLITGLVALPIAYFIYRANPNSGLFHGQPPVRAKPLPIKGKPPKPHFLNFTHSVSWRELLIALVIIAAVTALIVAWRNRVRLSLTDPQDLPAADEPDAELARAVESGRAALSELDDARAAIIACYLAMEASLAQAGTERGQAETPDELLVRAVAAGHVPSDPAGRLTSLFYEARFSSHDMPPAKRDQASGALAELAAHLPIGQP